MNEREQSYWTQLVLSAKAQMTEYGSVVVAADAELRELRAECNALIVERDQLRAEVKRADEEIDARIADAIQISSKAANLEDDYNALHARVTELDAENQAMMNQIDDLATKCEAVEGMTTVQSLAHVAVGNGVEWVLYDDLDVLRDGTTPWEALGLKED